MFCFLIVAPARFENVPKSISMKPLKGRVCSYPIRVTFSCLWYDRCQSVAVQTYEHQMTTLQGRARPR
jgi:hypothetical protein